MSLTLGSFCSGIGGIEQGLQAAFASRGIDLTVSWQVEIDDYCQQVLQRHYPDSKKYKDLNDDIDQEIRDQPTDIICFGFPCQGLSVAGKGEGLADPRSHLFYRCWQLSMLVRPRYIFIENVPNVTANESMSAVLTTVAASGYDAEWTHLSAEQCFAPHKRNRFWMVCYPSVANPNSQPIRAQ